MLTVNYSSKFKKELKLMEKRSLDMRKIFAVMVDLQNEIPLQPKHKEHLLQGGYKGFLECRIEPDWLIIYQIDQQAKELYFSRTGSHSDLFNS
jgi:mRNA interferase YafQ